MAQNTKQLQQPDKHRHHPISLPQTNPLVTQERRMEHQQRLQNNQHFQQQYYYGQQSPPPMGVLYNPYPWYPDQERRLQQYPPVNYQYWYGTPQYMNSPPGFPQSSALPRIIAPSFYHNPNGTQGQFVSAGQPPIKPATKPRSRSTTKDRGQNLALQGRHKAGGRMSVPKKTSADCSLNKIDSLSNFQSGKGLHIPASEQLMAKYRSTASLQQKKRVLEQEKEIVKKEIGNEKEDEPNLGNGNSSLFRRLAQYVRFRSARKAKPMKNGNGSNDTANQVFSSASSAKKHGFLSRLFGEIESNREGQSKTGCHSHVHYPTNKPIISIAQDEARIADSFKKVHAASQSKKSKKNKDNSRLDGK